MPSAHRKAPPTQEVNPRPTHIQSSEVHIKIWHQAAEHFSLCCNHDLWTFVIAGESYFAAALQGLARFAGPEKKTIWQSFLFLLQSPLNVPAAGFRGFEAKSSDCLVRLSVWFCDIGLIPLHDEVMREEFCPGSPRPPEVPPLFWWTARTLPLAVRRRFSFADFA